MPPYPGEVYVDDATVIDGELLYRMVTAANTKFEGGVAVRAGTNAFQDQRAELLLELGVPAVAVSVYLESEMAARGVVVADLVERWGPRYGVVSITAGEARSKGQGIIRWPQEGHPEHGMIFTLQGPSKTRGQSKGLAALTRVVIAPPES